MVSPSMTRARTALYAQSDPTTAAAISVDHNHHGYFRSSVINEIVAQTAAWMVETSAAITVTTFSTKTGRSHSSAAVLRRVMTSSSRAPAVFCVRVESDSDAYAESLAVHPRIQVDLSPLQGR